MILAASIVSAVLAFIPAALFLRNLRLYRSLPWPDGAGRSCSVLIPARNEETNIADCLRSLMQNEGLDIEVVVLDDHSTDRTAEIVREFSARDSRIRLESASPLPAGWCGKSFACHQLATQARHDLLVFMDADVRASKTDALARLALFVDASGAALVSGVPRQQTGSIMEHLIIPLIHFVLLGFLPLARMRQSTDPRFAAACGQILAVRRDTYHRSGGHSAISDRLHDGIALARNIRAHGSHTDLFDATDTFVCRMYRSASEVWHGFAKNAHEALATPRMIVPATLLLIGGQVLPLVLLLLTPTIPTALATAAAFIPRLAGTIRFRQSILGALFHPLGITVLVAIQWFAFVCTLRKRPANWKGRSYATA